MADTRVLRNLIAALVLAAIGGVSPVAKAQISAGPKGLIGGALMGAELVVIGEAIAGVQTDWLYLAGASVGGVAGGVGGYFVDDLDKPGLSVALLVGGMALSIPAFVVSLNATRRHWSEPTERRSPSGPTPNPPDPSAGPELSLQLLPKGGRKLIRWNAVRRHASNRALELAVPDVYITEAFSHADRQRYQLPMARLIQVPVFTASW
jgi:hypothetical protein